MKEQLSLKKKEIVNEIKTLRSAYHKNLLDTSQLNKSIENRQVSCNDLNRSIEDKSLLTNRQSELI